MHIPISTQVHESAHIYPGARIGGNCIIKEGAVIRHNVILGNNCYVGPNAVIGEPGEHLGHHLPNKDMEPKGKVIIGDNCRISEFCRIQSPCNSEITSIGQDCYLMAGVHIGHDAVLHSNVTIAPNAVVGGEVLIGQYSRIGMGAVIHQNATIPIGTMLGMGAKFTKRCDPGEWKIIVNIGDVVAWNVIGMRRAGMTDEEITLITNKKKIIYPE